MSDNICCYCSNKFSNKYILKRHLLERCVIKQDPEKLLEIIEQKNRLLEQKDVLIEQQANTIEQLKEAKPVVDVDNSSNIDNSVNKTIKTINNIDNSVINNITLIEQPFALRSEDMVYLLQFHEDKNKGDYLILLKNIHKAMKNGDLDGMLNSLFTFIHNNKHLKQGQNIRYCPDGIHKGILIYDYDEKGVGYWRPSDIRPISFVLSLEFDHLHARQREIDLESEKVKIPISKKEERNIANLTSMSTTMHEDLETQEAIIKFIKKLEMSKHIPDNIRNDPQEDNIHPLDNKLSSAAIAHKKYIKKLGKSKKDKKMDESESSESSESTDKEQRKRDIENEKARQLRKAEEAEEERKEQAYKRKCEIDGTDYVPKAERIVLEHYAKISKSEKYHKSGKSKEVKK
jgi:hypothetical protein